LPLALIADDDSAIREVMTEVCVELGLEVTSVSDGVTALESMRRSPPDLVLLDLAMPRLDGYGVLEKLRDGLVRPQPAVIVVTANADASGRIRGTELGAVDFIEKPFRLPDLRRRLERVIAVVQLERRLEDAEQTLEMMRSRDPVTGAGTFGMLSAALETQFQFARITGKELSCVVMSDERNALVENEAGKEAADQRLQKVAKIVERVLRGADLMFRVDAAEFVLLLPGTPAAGARRVVDRIQEALSAAGLEDDVSLVVASATYPHPEITQASVLYRAVNVTLAQARSRDERRVAHFEGF
jgi:two-component system, cell cycle response regulator